MIIDKITSKFNKPVYKCDLISVTSSIKIKNDLSKKDNIKRANVTTPFLRNCEENQIKIVDKILVQKTMNDKYYREIITGKKIPVYKTIFCDSLAITIFNLGYFKYVLTDSPIFVKVNETRFFNNPREDDLKIATVDEIQEYRELNNDRCLFLDKLNQYFSQAEINYNNAKELEDFVHIKKLSVK